VKRIFGTAIVAAAAAAVVFYHYIFAAVAAPVFLYVLWRIWSSTQASLEEIADLKYAPSDERRTDRTRLEGNWEVCWRGGDWTAVKVPSDLATIAGIDTHFIKYRRKVELKRPAKNGRLFLCGRGFGGVGDIYINEVRTGGPVFGYLPFEVELPESVAQPTEFDLRIDIHELKGPEAPGRSRGLAPPFGAGLFRDIYVEERDKIVFSSMDMEYSEAGGDYAIKALINGSSGDDPVAVSIQIETINDKKTVFSGVEIIPGFSGRTVVRIDVPRECLEAWTCEKPEMYLIKVQAVCGELRISNEFKSGVSGVVLKDERVYVNGKKQTLLGLRRSEHYPPYGAAVPRWAAKKDVQAVKEIGFNTIYCEDYPPNSDFMEECDRAGVFFIAEFPYSEAKRVLGEEQALKLLDAETEKALGHPSFLFWVIKMEDASIVEKMASAWTDRIVFSHGAASERAGGGEANFTAEKCDIDLYRLDTLEREAARRIKSGAGLVVFDFIDTAGGREDRRARELRKAAADLKVLKVAHAFDAGAVILGGLFTWGLRQGVLSINRSKKSSSDAIREYLRTREVAEPDYHNFPVRLPLRAIPLMAALFVIGWIVVPHAREFFLTAPASYHCFRNALFFVIIGAVMFLLPVFSISLVPEWNRGLLPGIATKLGYPAMYSLYNRHWVRLSLVFSVQAYLLFIGILTMSLLTGEDMKSLIPRLAAASVFDAVFLVMLFGYVEPVLVTCAAAILGGIYLCWFFQPGQAAVFEAVRWLPWFITFGYLRTRDIFRHAIK